MEQIAYDDFQKVAMRTGTILEAEENLKARIPAYTLTIDFGKYGIKTSSAQITQNYACADLVGKQIVAVMNFAPKLIASVKSEVLVLGAMSEENDVVLLEPTFGVENGAPIG